jgi:hypothetical protein
MARISPNFVANEAIIVVGAPRCTGHAQVCRDCGLRSNYILMSTLLKLAGSPQQAVGTCDNPPAGSTQSVAFSPAVPLFCDLNQPELSLEPDALALTIRPTTKLQKSFGARMAQLSAILLSASWRQTRPPRWIKTKRKELLLRETLGRGVGLVRSGRHDRLQAAN